MTWDAYLILKTAGIAVFVIGGGISAAKVLPLSREKAYLINLLAVLVGYFCNRSWYIVQHLYGSEPYEFKTAWEAWQDAGSVLYGWVIGGTLALIFLTRKLKIPTVRYLDAVLPWLLVAQVLNRLGCFDAGCCFGGPTTCPISVAGSSDADRIHPVQIYEAFFDALWVWFIWTRPKRAGLPTMLYFTGYPLARFFLEFLRGDNAPAFLFMTVPQVTSVLIFVTVFVLRKRILSHR